MGLKFYYVIYIVYVYCSIYVVYIQYIYSVYINSIYNIYIYIYLCVCLYGSIYICKVYRVYVRYVRQLLILHSLLLYVWSFTCIYIYAKTYMYNQIPQILKHLVLALVCYIFYLCLNKDMYLCYIHKSYFLTMINNAHLAIVIIKQKLLMTGSRDIGVGQRISNFIKKWYLVMSQSQSRSL